MGKLAIQEEASTPSTPSQGFVLYATTATPSIPKIVDDADGNYTIAMLEKAQTFTTVQTIAPTATNVNGAKINMPTSNTGVAIQFEYNGGYRGGFYARSGFNYFEAYDCDLGSNVEGPSLVVGRNTNANGSAGTFAAHIRGGGNRYLWVDASASPGVLRLHTSAPTTSASDTAGTVVGTQTSWHELKKNIVAHFSNDDLLQAVLNVRLYDFQMRQDSSGNNYTGIVITDEDKRNRVWYGQNMADDQIPALNERNLFGYLIGAVQALAGQIKGLSADVAALKAGA